MRKTKSYENQEGAYMKLVKKIVDVALIFVLMVSMVGCNTTTNKQKEYQVNNNDYIVSVL